MRSPAAPGLLPHTSGEHPQLFRSLVRIELRWLPPHSLFVSMFLLCIALGTTYCAVASLDDRGRPFTVPNRDGEVLTPSAVYLAPDGSAVVGQPALDMALEQPDRVAMLIKRRMGVPDYGHPVAGREFRPE